MLKKRKISGPDLIELDQILDSLKRYKRRIEMTEEEGEDAGEASTKTLDELAEFRRSEPRALSFSGADYELLRKLNIVASGDLRLKSNHKELAQESKLVGKDGLWSSAQMYRHLELLGGLTPIENEAGASVWIDTFLFRASAMVPPGYRMVFNIEQSIPATATQPLILATVYTVVTAKNDVADVYRSWPEVETARRYNTGFFVTEAKSSPISKDIPQALCELYWSGRQLQREKVRGALTNGHDWMFIILYFGADGKGASYKHSGIVRCPAMGDKKPEDPYPDVIAGILSYWTRKSSDDIDEDDWFEEFRPLP